MYATVRRTARKSAARVAARKWARQMGIDLTTWPGGLKDFTKALAR